MKDYSKIGQQSLYLAAKTFFSFEALRMTQLNQKVPRHWRIEMSWL